MGFDIPTAANKDSPITPIEASVVVKPQRSLWYRCFTHSPVTSARFLCVFSRFTCKSITKNAGNSLRDGAFVYHRGIWLLRVSDIEIVRKQTRARAVPITPACDHRASILVRRNRNENVIQLRSEFALTKINFVQFAVREGYKWSWNAFRKCVLREMYVHEQCRSLYFVQ